MDEIEAFETIASPEGIINFTSLREARQFFQERRPSIVDYYNWLDRYAGHHRARIVWWDGRNEADHTVECPGQAEDGGWDHDCWRQGCGKSYSDDWSHGMRVEVFVRNEWREVAAYNNNERGGMGY